MVPKATATREMSDSVTCLTDAGSSSDDADLKRRVESFLYERQRAALRTVEVDVVHGAVVLQGRVNTFYEKQICLSCCQRVAGVLKLIDEIEVD